MIIPFERRDEDSLVVVNAQLDRIQIFMAVDTGASHTVLDVNILLIQGYELKDAVRSILVETANGEIEAMIFKIKRMSALGIEKKDIEICAYDFIASRMIKDFDGLLGLDFYGDRKICFDFVECLVSLEAKRVG